MRLPPSRLVRIGLGAVSALIVAAAVVGGIQWARYPKAPDVSKAPLEDVMHFTATDEFNRMTEAHRKRYLLALVGRFHEKSFPDLVSMMLSADPDRRKEMENMKLLTEADRKEIGGAWMRLFLDKFFDQPKMQRDVYLTMFALQEKAGGAWMRLFLDKFFDQPKMQRDVYLTMFALQEKAGGARRGGGAPPGLPTAEQIQKGMSDFLSEQPPHAAAQMDELMNEMNQKRKMLGMTGPWG